MAAALAVPALSGCTTAVASQSVAAAPTGANVEWPSPPGDARYQAGGILLTMENRISGADSEILERVLTVEAPGLPAFTIDAGEDTRFGPSVMVVETPAGTPMVLFQTYSGGAHCCTTINVIEPRGGRLQATMIYEGDGGPMEDAPRDLDGDGLIDFVRYDNGFLYAFASYAESFAPPTIVNVVDGQAVDVSKRPGFRSLFEEEATRAREACASGEGNRNGACASFVAASARLGRFDAAWADMLRLYDRDSDWDWPTGCRVAATERACPEDQRITYATFPEALRAHLVALGYIAR